MKNAVVIGDKVFLRPLELDDISNGWHDWINTEISQGSLLSPLPVTIDGLRNYWELSQTPSVVMFAVCEIETGRYIGNARLSDINWVHRSATYGRLIGQAFRNSGLGTEALILLLKYGFEQLGLNRIWSTAWAENKISLKSNYKIGMKSEGIMREAVFKNGKFHDTVILAMTRSDYDALYLKGP
ncbi:GNAT family N-acetyltransferase [Paracoccaceae bacterium]|nr:GNAT family N-acetyltransferase [Paracoccaceae bacterium]